MQHWRGWSHEEHPEVSSFLAFTDIQPSRYALSYIIEPNENAYHVEVAFIAVDSENLGEMVNDQYHTDFGDNKFPYFKGNTNVQINLDKFSSEDNSDDENESDNEDNDGAEAPSRDDVTTNINKFIPPSMKLYLSSK